jgi:hypothetical protein
MMSWSRVVILLVLVLASTGYGQPVDPYYQEDFANDNLYHDYAARQQEKLVGAPKYVILALLLMLTRGSGEMSAWCLCNTLGACFLIPLTLFFAPPFITSTNSALPWGKLVAATVCGWFIGGKYHAGKVTKKLSTKHKQEQKELYTQYYNDVYTLKEQNMQLIQALEQMGVKVK